MTTICRIPWQTGQLVPRLECDFEDGFMVVRAPDSVHIVDASELCQYMRCRKPVAKGLKGAESLNHCEEHAEYYRKMQKQNYEKHIMKNESGLCVRQGCNKPQAQNKKTGLVGRCCQEHADQKNQTVKEAYKRKKGF
jgi:hypothetical protein